MSEYDPNFHLKPPTFKTVRETRLESLLVECLPYLIAESVANKQTAGKLEVLIDRVTEVTK